MSILNVDKIQPIGSGSTVTVNATDTILTNAQAGVVTCTSVTLSTDIVHSGDTNTKIRFPAADTITADTAGDERVRITSTGNVGINENSPASKLTITQDPQGFVDDSAQPQATFLIKHGTTGSNRRWVGIGASLTGAWLQSSSPGGSGLSAPFWINKGGGDVTLGNNKFTVASGGNVSIIDGNLIVANGHGIDFSATGNGNGTMGNELLDDYEEGSWSPTIYGGTTAGSYSYEAARTGGKYTKIGNMVYIEGVLRISAINSAGAGDLYMGGLPYSTSGPMASSWVIGKGVQFLMYGTSGNTTASIAEPPFVGTASGGASAFNIRSYGKNLNVMPQIEDFDNQWWIFQVAGWYPVS